MTNAEKYKSAKERAEAFNEYCKNQDCSDAGNCPLKGCNDIFTDTTCCLAYWLDLEAEAEEPLPCPFCGSKCYVDGGEKYYGEYWIQCADSHCDYSSASKGNSDAAIAAHNRVARAANGGDK